MQSIKTVEYDCIIYLNEFHRKHREDGPAKIYTQENARGDEAWFFDGKYHRIGGPAIIWLGKRWNIDHSTRKFEWLRMDRFHRLNAPAVIRHNGIDNEYWEFGNPIK